MNAADIPPITNENTLHSIIIRYWRGQDGEVRGQFIDPVTQRIFTFTSIAGLHEVLTRVVQELPKVEIDPQEQK